MFGKSGIFSKIVNLIPFWYSVFNPLEVGLFIIFCDFSFIKFSFHFKQIVHCYDMEL